jgi:arylsulfatase A-like enzyme
MPKMPDRVPLLAEYLSDAGYDTVGVPGPAKMGHATGLDRGFDWYYEVHTEVADRPSLPWAKQLVFDSAIRRDFIRTLTKGNDYYNELRIEKLEEGIRQTVEPFFAMMNLTTVHAPYDPPRPYKQNETPSLSRPRLPILEELNNTYGQINSDEIRPDRLYEASRGRNSANIRLRYLHNQSYVNDAELEFLRRWYSASVRYLDDQIGRVLDSLRSQDRLQNTIVIFTSDHGEFFGEHGLMYHGRYLHDEVTHVPMILAGPNVPTGERRTELASIVDVFPTVCRLIGLRAPSTAGVDVFGSETRDVVYAEQCEFDDSELPAAAVVPREVRLASEAGRKSIRTTEHRFEITSKGDEYLFTVPDGDLVESPDEQLVESLRGQLLDTLGTDYQGNSGSEREFTPGVERNLRELGYIE